MRNRGECRAWTLLAYAEGFLIVLLPAAAWATPDAFQTGCPLPFEGIEESHPIDQACDLSVWQILPVHVVDVRTKSSTGKCQAENEEGLGAAARVGSAGGAGGVSPISAE